MEVQSELDCAAKTRDVLQRMGGAYAEGFGKAQQAFRMMEIKIKMKLHGLRATHQQLPLTPSELIELLTLLDEFPAEAANLEKVEVNLARLERVMALLDKPQQVVQVVQQAVWGPPPPGYLPLEHQGHFRAPLLGLTDDEPILQQQQYHHQQQQRSPATCFVASLPPFATPETVRTLFAPFGEVREVYLDPEGGSGSVEFESSRAARKAATALHQLDWHGHFLSVVAGNAASDFFFF